MCFRGDPMIPPLVNSELNKHEELHGKYMFSFCFVLFHFLPLFLRNLFSLSLFEALLCVNINRIQPMTAKYQRQRPDPQRTNKYDMECSFDRTRLSP